MVPTGDQVINCEYADEARLPFLNHLFKKYDLLLIQEHGLYKSRLSWFHEINKEKDDSVGIHGVSAMCEDQVLRGRPHGSTAIL